MKKILVFGLSDNLGGVERFILNTFFKINNPNIQFDFLSNTKNQIVYEKEIIAHGSKIYHITPRRKNPIAFEYELNNFMKKSAKFYDVLWLNATDLVNIEYLKLAKKYGIKRRIIHSHNAGLMDGGIKGKVKLVLHNKHRKEIEKWGTDFWACSESAAKWCFPSSLDPKIKIIKNAINYKDFAFNLKSRQKLRKEYAIGNAFVIGNVGRLHFEKNQIFSLKVFKEYLKLNPNSYLFLVGQGPDYEYLKNVVTKLGLETKVRLVGAQKDIAPWYSFFDFFLFPSLFEGLGIAGIEAQANGLSTIAAQNDIPKELKINGNFEFLDLQLSPSDWANQIFQMSKVRRLSQKNIDINFKKKKYILEDQILTLTNLFLEEKV